MICRLFQGFAAGGEWGGAAVFLVEYAPQNQRGYISSFQQIGTGLGLLLATFFAAMLTYFLDAERVPVLGLAHTVSGRLHPRSRLVTTCGRM